MAVMSQMLTPAAPTRDRGHRIRVRIAGFTSFLVVAALAAYGWNYYLLPIEERPFSPKHVLLRPSGAIGLKLGYLGVALFVFIFLYAFRRIFPWLGRIGSARQWMDFHAIAGATAPVIIAFHASFKFRGIAGIAFWIMVAVALSGVIGRYLYAQIPRSISAAELSFKDLRASEELLREELLAQSVYSAEQLERALHVPSPEHIRQIPALVALGEMLVLDVRQRFHLAALRRAASGVWGSVRSLGGMVSSGNAEVEHVVRIVRQKASLSRRIVFLDRTRSVFHLWHVVHRPFSYAFVVLAVIHIVVVMGFGF
ncbi:MAG: hypothetical protein ACLGXA_00170 [Acidobacteriota bacterium]